MNRRDIIITAVLINAGLLIVLFVCSLKPLQSKDVAVTATMVRPPEAVYVKEMISSQKRESNVDLGITAMAKKEMPLPTKKDVQPAQTPVAAPVSPPAAVTPPAPAPKNEKPAPVPKPVPPKPAPAPVLAQIEVQAGDALEKIAKQHGIAVDDLMRANQLADSRLKIGQKLVIPVAEKILPSPVSKAKDEDSYEYYVVKNGDNPWTIAVKNHIKVDDLLRLNDLDENKARRLKPGDKLRIR